MGANKMCQYFDQNMTVHYTLYLYKKCHVLSNIIEKSCLTIQPKSKATHLCVFLRTHKMPNNHVKVLTVLGMHSNKLKLSGRLTVEFELPDMKNPLCSDTLSQPQKRVRVKKAKSQSQGEIAWNNIVMEWPCCLLLADVGM